MAKDSLRSVSQSVTAHVSARSRQSSAHEAQSEAQRQGQRELFELRELLSALDGVLQSPRYHPEGDALFHSLQVFDLARQSSDDRVLWAAALFHDVGKAIDGPSHDEVGADLLAEFPSLIPPRAVWLVRHHLDLMKDRRLIERRLRGTRALHELELLRRWDVGGRDPKACVLAIDDAIDIVFAGDAMLEDPSAEALDEYLGDAVNALPYGANERPRRS